MRSACAGSLAGRTGLESPSPRAREPLESLEVTGWPVVTLSRGDIVTENGKVLGQPGRGQLLKRKGFAAIRNVENAS